MADLGSIGRYDGINTPAYIGGITWPKVYALSSFNPTWYGNTISGIVKDDTDTPAIRIVRVYNRATGQFINQTTSSVDGTFTLTLPNNSISTVICLDDDAGINYNALIYDRVLPT